jgi:hypothetical protein
VFYKGVANTGIQNNVGYLSVGLGLTGGWPYFEFLPVPLCFYDETASEFEEVEGNRRLADNDYSNCPDDGSYPFLVTYVLPWGPCRKGHPQKYDWHDDGYLRLYAAENENSLIGECQMTIHTFMEHSIIDSLDSLLDTLSAATVASIMIGSLAALLLLCCSCCYCYRRQYRESKKVSHIEDHVTSFRRMTSHDGAPDESPNCEKTLLT